MSRLKNQFNLLLNWLKIISHLVEKEDEINIVFDNKTPYIIAGAGEFKKLNNIKCQKIGSKITSFLNSHKIANANISFDIEKEEYHICNIAFGATLQSYRFNKYFVDKKKDKEFQC